MNFTRTATFSNSIALAVDNKIFRVKRKGSAGGWRIQCDMINNVYLSQGVTKDVKMRNMIPINQPTRRKNFPNLLLDVCVRFNMCLTSAK